MRTDQNWEINKGKENGVRERHKATDKDDGYYTVNYSNRIRCVCNKSLLSFSNSGIFPCQILLLFLKFLKAISILALIETCLLPVFESNFGFFFFFLGSLIGWIRKWSFLSKWDSWEHMRYVELVSWASIISFLEVS